MGLILDTSILIAGERGGVSVDDLLNAVRRYYGESEVGLSAVTVVELSHGIYRTRTPEQRVRRRDYAETAFAAFAVYPLTYKIGWLAGQIEGELGATGFAVGFEDLVIGATALHLGFSVATLNVRHFNLIPGLDVVTLPA